MAATELISSRSFGTELGGKRTLELVFRVDSTPDVALQDPLIPLEGTAFVADPSLLCDRRSASYMNGSVNQSIVTCYFSNDRSYRGAPHIDKLKAGYTEFEVDFVDATEEIPVQVWTPNGLQYDRIEPNGEVVRRSLNIWDIQKINAINYQTAIQVQVVLSTFSMADAAIIGGQAGKLHQISGEWYRFKAGKVRRRDETKYETVYTWVSDPGVPQLPPGYDKNGTLVVIPPGIFHSQLGIPDPPGYGGWTRPPYEVIRPQINNTLDEANGEQEQHEFIAFLPLTKMPLGFKALPGNPL